MSMCCDSCDAVVCFMYVLLCSKVSNFTRCFFLHKHMYCFIFFTLVALLHGIKLTLFICKHVPCDSRYLY